MAGSRRPRRAKRAISADKLPGFAYGGGYGTLQPWSELVLPPVGGEGFADLLWPQAVQHRAMSIPGVARGVSLIRDLVRTMPLDLYRGSVLQDRPALLSQPCPDAGTAWWVGVQVEDYLLHGNALHYVTSRSASTGYPLSFAWLPAQWTSISRDPDTGDLAYWVNGTRLRTADVVHVRRGADPAFPDRGLGFVEQFLDTIRRVKDQDAYESRTMRGGSVPSVAVITGNPNLSQDEADAAKSQWVSKYSGPTREPAILPQGTSVVPLAWSPADSQMTEARKASLLDLSNALGLDGFWLGAESAGLQYKSMGPMFTNLVRQTIAPILRDIEDVWSMRWVPYGSTIQFDRNEVTREDFLTELAAMTNAYKAGVVTLDEARARLRLPPAPQELTALPPAAPATVDPTGTTDPTSEGIQA